MSEKIYIRKVERYTMWDASNPIEIDVDKLRQCEPPYEGDSPEDLVNYLTENVWGEYEFYENETNIEVYGEDAVYDLVMEECYVENEFFDSRTKGEEANIQVGVPNEKYTRYGGFEVLASSGY